MLMDFGIYKLRAGSVVPVLEEKEECLFMLIEGNVSCKWNRKENESARKSCFNEVPGSIKCSKGYKRLL